jgi:Rhodopirellula transposase DDE domain/Insertion element 4 transposase N-terminal
VINQDTPSTTLDHSSLPARLAVYLLLAGALFEECGYPAVWARLTAALGSLPLPQITATGLWHARARLGVRPLRALFDLLRGSAAAIRTTGARWAAGRLLITAGCGGSNSYRYRVWKAELAALAAETGLAVTVCHFPPAPPSGTQD